MMIPYDSNKTRLKLGDVLVEQWVSGPVIQTYQYKVESINDGVLHMKTVHCSTDPNFDEEYNFTDDSLRAVVNNNTGERHWWYIRSGDFLPTELFKI